MGTFVVAVCFSEMLHAQDLAPRVYTISPVHSNAITLIWSLYRGGLNFAGTIPITGATGTYQVPTFSYYHSFSLLGRSANVNGALPYGVGNFQGSVLGTQQQTYRSGLLGTSVRFSVNLKGGPAMPVKEFAHWKQTSLFGASLKIIAPTGQYDSAKLINWGINRWAVKPELGYSQRWGSWLLDGYGGVWFYTANPRSFSVPEPKRQTQEPIGSFEGHLSYDFRRDARLWASLDGNFWVGGTTTLDGTRNPATMQKSSRIGGTASFPVSKHQSIKLSYSDGAYVSFGGNYHNVSVAWQYSWLGRPE
jgi:hypothetical protein